MSTHEEENYSAQTRESKINCLRRGGWHASTIQFNGYSIVRGFAIQKEKEEGPKGEGVRETSKRYGSIISGEKAYPRP